MPERVTLFVDGFNYYYGLFRGAPIRCHPRSKWANPVLLGQAICRQIGVDGIIRQVHYCSAPSLPGPNDPGQATRQQHYFLALSGIPEITVTLGRHFEKPKSVRAIDPVTGNATGPAIKAMVREEKGSDVNLASFLVRDAAQDRFDVAIVLSNDSDLANAVRIAREDFGKEVVVVSPQVNHRDRRGRRRVSYDLARAASRSLVLDHNLLSNCRLPDPYPDADGNLIHCPAEWS
jgi:uncharacterized LabA/DUF88 family protein